MPDISNIKILLLYFIIINIIGLVLFGLDKRRAKRGAWRVRERDLFLVAIAGGSLGGLLGMYLFRHKTQHLKFKLGFPLIILLQLALLFYINQ
ncbi:MAG: DUF1294 domain-containing protein [Clostridiaceae bacterium]|jgi:uncharacterized membrane protein YsdA (DUF1294 family)|nr:DUF1294 domain-containing protein [Clostridiaceae bacterium]